LKGSFVEYQAIESSWLAKARILEAETESGFRLRKLLSSC